MPAHLLVAIPAISERGLTRTHWGQTMAQNWARTAEQSIDFCVWEGH